MVRGTESECKFHGGAVPEGDGVRCVTAEEGGHWRCETGKQVGHQSS